MTKISFFHAAKSSTLSSRSDMRGANGAHYQKIIKIASLMLLAIMLSACAWNGAKTSGKSYVIKGKRYYILSSAQGFKEKGIASWYGEPFHGRRTASGEVFDMNKISAAHKTLPLHTWVRVINLENKKEMALRINDRGPFIDGRIIDLSRAAAQHLDVYRKGTARVRVEAITGEKARKLAAAEAQRNAQLAAQQARSRAAEQKQNKQKAGVKKNNPQAQKRYSVEVPISSNPELAKRLLSDLRRDYNKVNMYMRHQQDGDLLFYVAVNDLLSMEAATNLRNHLSKNGYGQSNLIIIR